MNDDETILYGCAAIGTVINRTPKQTNHIANEGDLPIFKLGGVWAARPSALRAEIERREREAMQRAQQRGRP